MPKDFYLFPKQSLIFVLSIFLFVSLISTALTSNGKRLPNHPFKTFIPLSNGNHLMREKSIFSGKAPGSLAEYAIPRKGQIPTRPYSSGKFLFHVRGVGFDETAMGFAPEHMRRSDRVLFIELNLVSGKREAFRDFEIRLLVNQTKRKRKPFLMTSDGIIKMLANVVVKMTAKKYQPDPRFFVWAFAVPKKASEFQLVLPTGEMISLNEWIQKFIPDSLKP